MVTDRGEGEGWAKNELNAHSHANLNGIEAEQEGVVTLIMILAVAQNRAYSYVKLECSTECIKFQLN